MPVSRPRLELVWPGKDQFLLTPSGDNGKPIWVGPGHPAAHEVRLTGFTDACGHVNDTDPYADNLVFTGDSLDVLRVLCEVPEYRRHYRGKVKLIYIDPPFNTGQTFEHYDDWMEHSTWLSFIRDRLLLMKELLASDGSIWVHLDDAEVHRMRCLLDEVFGASGFVGTAIWEKVTSPRNDATGFSVDHDYVMVYAADKPSFRLNGLPRTASSDAAYKNPDDDPRGPWREGDYKSNKTAEQRPNLYYPVIHPNSGEEVWPPKSAVWRYSRERHLQNVAENLVWWGKTGNYSLPKIKRFRSDAPSVAVPRTLWTSAEVDTTRRAKQHVKSLFAGLTPFDTPKPERLLQRIIQIGSNSGRHRGGRVRWIGDDGGGLAQDGSPVDYGGTLPRDGQEVHRAPTPKGRRRR